MMPKYLVQFKKEFIVMFNISAKDEDLAIEKAQEKLDKYSQKDLENSTKTEFYEENEWELDDCNEE